MLVAIAIGVLLGHFRPDIGEQMKPLGDGFIKLVKMIIAPVIFLIIVVGLRHAGPRHFAALGGKVPVESVALVLGVDRFMSEARAITNFIGNGVATMVVAKWEGLRDDAKVHAAFAAGPEPALADRARSRPGRLSIPAHNASLRG